MFCYIHSKRLAVDKCVQCGVALCADCASTFRGYILCKACSPEGKKPVRGKPVYYRNPLFAALLSIIPGVGQFYNGQLFKGLIVLSTCWLIVPWFYGIYDAYATACRINNRDVIQTDPFPELMTALCVLIIFVSAFFVVGPDAWKIMIHQQLLPMIMNSLEWKAQRALKDMALGLESFHKTYGYYPDDISQLYFEEPPYLERLYCDATFYSYTFTCNSDATSYKVRAVPQDPEKSVFELTTGGKVLVYKVVKPEEEDPF